MNVVDFGDLTPETNALLQQGVVAYRGDRAHANALFRQALEQAPQELPVSFCLYKFHAYRGDLDEALAMARSRHFRAKSDRKSGAIRALYAQGPRLRPSPPRRKGPRPSQMRRSRRTRSFRPGGLAGDRDAG